MVLKTVVWEEQVDGVSVFEAVLIAHTTKNGELVTLSSQFVPDPVGAATVASRTGRRLLAAPDVPARRAVAIAARNVGETFPRKASNRKPGVGGRSSKAANVQGPRAQRRRDQLVWLPASKERLRLGWEVILTSRARGEMFRVLVDVQTGEAVLRQSLTAYLSEATYRVNISDSPSPFSPGLLTPQSTQPALVPRVLIVTNAFDIIASANGWMDDAVMKPGQQC